MAFVIVTAWGTLGDTLPYIAVGAELRRRGHQVALVSSPAFQRQAEEGDLELVPVGTLADYEEFIQDPALWDRETVVKAVVKYWLRNAQGLYEAIVRAHRPGKTALFAGPTNVPARLAQEKLGIPYVSGLVAPSRMSSRSDPPHPSRPFPAWTNAFLRTRTGLRLLRELRSALRGKRSLGSTRLTFEEVKRLREVAGLPQVPGNTNGFKNEPVVCLWPDWFSAPQKDWPAGAKTTGFPFFPDLPQRSPRPAPNDRLRPIVFTRGSIASHQSSFFAIAIECCRILGRPGVLVTRHVENVPPDLPAGVEHVDFASFAELFSRAAAVVHHGGIGTIAHALAAGIPQVVLPIVGEQFDLGYRMERLGVGRMLTEIPLSAARLGAEVARLLDSPGVERRCHRFQEKIDPAAGTSLAADGIEEKIDRGA